MSRNIEDKREKPQKIEQLSESLNGLSDPQIDAVSRVIKNLQCPYIRIEQLKSSAIVSGEFLHRFGDALKIHHALSNEPFTKDKFEYTLEYIAKIIGKNVELAPRGNPGHDLTIDGVKFSLKTQADQSIRIDEIHISKFMELGKGAWTDSVEQLEGLREQFLSHMKSYDRILTLRCISKYPKPWHYELVEIPKELLQQAQSGILRMQTKSTQSPKPGYCDIVDSSGELQFQCYFDGGTERKLQIKHLLKKNCVLHATWIFAME